MPSPTSGTPLPRKPKGPGLQPLKDSILLPLNFTSTFLKNQCWWRATPEGRDMTTNSPLILTLKVTLRLMMERWGRRDLMDMVIRTELTLETMTIVKNCHNTPERARIMMNLWVMLSQTFVTSLQEHTMLEGTVLLHHINLIFTPSLTKILTRRGRVTNIPSILPVDLNLSPHTPFRRKITLQNTAGETNK